MAWFIVIRNNSSEKINHEYAAITSMQRCFGYIFNILFFMLTLANKKWRLKRFTEAYIIENGLANCRDDDRVTRETKLCIIS